MEYPILKAIADNPALFEALRSLFEKNFAVPTNQKEIPVGLTDENLGQYFRARITGMDTVNRVLADIAKYKSGTDIEKKVNQAR